MSHHKFWVLGITSILLLSTVSQAVADDNTEVRAGKVRIIRDADGNTQIETDRVKVQTNSVDLQRSNRYRTRRTIRTSVITTPTNSIDSCLDRDTSIQRANNSSGSTNTQINKIRGNNRTVIQSSTDR
ncbi:hypothetical protein [Chamaesiphon sp. GL140_3_metabinner_50]|uniref:hypothetical protein n=1 Tax=Chamaesiphon sp. GL140_3_metabinner_50 TaxID=2970812 RepID=UPI0025FB3242|nr:hypothetical protein [Chamaesiphon sp. GL140_3_metabinner_50]